MPYIVQITPPAAKELERLPPPIRALIVLRIRALADNPRPPGVKKLKGEPNGWRIRVGDYRVVYEIHDKILLVRVVRIRHRGSAYD